MDKASSMSFAAWNLSLFFLITAGKGGIYRQQTCGWNGWSMMKPSHKPAGMSRIRDMIGITLRSWGYNGIQPTASNTMRWVHVSRGSLMRWTVNHPILWYDLPTKTRWSKRSFLLQFRTATGKLRQTLWIGIRMLSVIVYRVSIKHWPCIFSYFLIHGGSPSYHPAINRWIFHENIQLLGIPHISMDWGGHISLSLLVSPLVKSGQVDIVDTTRCFMLFSSRNRFPGNSQLPISRWFSLIFYFTNPHLFGEFPMGNPPFFGDFALLFPRKNPPPFAFYICWDSRPWIGSRDGSWHRSASADEQLVGIPWVTGRF